MSPIVIVFVEFSFCYYLSTEISCNNVRLILLHATKSTKSNYYCLGYLPR